MGMGRGGNGEAETVEGGGPWGGGKGERGGDLEVGGGEAEMAMGRGRRGGGQQGGGDWEGATGRGRWGRGISQMDIMKYLGGHMECLGGMRLQSFLTLFTRAMPGTPASKK